MVRRRRLTIFENAKSTRLLGVFRLKHRADLDGILDEDGLRIVPQRHKSEGIQDGLQTKRNKILKLKKLTPRQAL